MLTVSSNWYLHLPLLKLNWFRLNKTAPYSSSVLRRLDLPMKRGSIGHFVPILSSAAETGRAFVPNSLPPEPALVIEGTLRDAIDDALLALGRLDGAAAMLPETDLFLYTYVRREAVLSSQIEGTRSSLSDLLLFELDEIPGVPLDDVTEVSNYVAALEIGLARLSSGLPLSGRILREMHATLLRSGRGADKRPGEYRLSQNWIGGTRPGNASFVPPPHDVVPEAMADLERFLNDIPARTPPLIKAALAHLQFETIHPFLDGNGRVGRLLIIMVLCSSGVLREPMLYISLYLREHRDTYFDLLEQVRREGDWEAWLEFFAGAVSESARSAVEIARALSERAATDRALIQDLGRAAGSALRIHRALRERPVATIAWLSEATGVSIPTVSKALDNLGHLGLVREITGNRRNRVFVYTRYLALLNEGTERGGG